MKSEIKNLSKKYVVVLCGCTLDVASNTLKGLSFISHFLKKTEHTNEIIIDAPCGVPSPTLSLGLTWRGVAFLRLLTAYAEVFKNSNFITEHF